MSRTPITEQNYELCGAKTRKGTPCQCPAIAGKKRCRLHGGLSLSGKDHPLYKTGKHTVENRRNRKFLKMIGKLL